MRHRTSLADEAPTPEAMAACAKVKKAKNNQLMWRQLSVVVGQESGVFYIDFLYVVLDVERRQDFPVVGKCLLISCSVLDDSNMLLIIPAAFMHRNDFLDWHQECHPPKDKLLRHR